MPKIDIPKSFLDFYETNHPLFWSLHSVIADFLHAKEISYKGYRFDINITIEYTDSMKDVYRD